MHRSDWLFEVNFAFAKNIKVKSSHDTQNSQLKINNFFKLLINVCSLGSTHKKKFLTKKFNFFLFNFIIFSKVRTSYKRLLQKIEFDSKFTTPADKQNQVFIGKFRGWKVRFLLLKMKFFYILSLDS